MTPETRLHLVNDRIADLHCERQADRLLAEASRQTPRPTRTPIFAVLRRVVAAFAA